MTIAPRSLSSLQLSLPPFSHFHPSSSPPAIPTLLPNDLSTRKFNHLFSAPHPSRAALGGEEGAQELSRDIAMDRDSVFHSSQSRVLRASLPFSSRRVRSSAVSSSTTSHRYRPLSFRTSSWLLREKTRAYAISSTYTNSISLFRIPIARAYSEVPLDSQGWLRRHQSH